ncbi:hypothetical protein GCK32_000260 [Trichostrongylus colubriformis]|uniref:Uncharacterized protein n=1 Tax=Trichostrongylus colubriformis TaxID=6319 RepID=A0AAN8ER95_TRICO
MIFKRAEKAPPGEDKDPLRTTMAVKAKKAATGRGRGRPPKAVKGDEVNGEEKSTVAKPVKTIEKASSGKKRGRPPGSGKKKAGRKSKATPKKKKAMSESEESDKEVEAVDGNESDDEGANE